MPEEWPSLVSRLSQPDLRRSDGVLALTNQARAFNQIKQQVQSQGLDLEEALFRVLPVPAQVSRSVFRQFKQDAAKSFALLTDGLVSQGWRSVIRPARRLVALLYDRSLDLFFMRFYRKTDDDPQPDLVIHVVTILDAQEAWRDWSEDINQTAGVDAVDYF